MLVAWLMVSVAPVPLAFSIVAFTVPEVRAPMVRLLPPSESLAPRMPTPRSGALWPASVRLLMVMSCPSVVAKLVEPLLTLKVTLVFASGIAATVELVASV